MWPEEYFVDLLCEIPFLCKIEMNAFQFTCTYIDL